MTHSLNHFILKFLAHCREIGVIARYSDQQMAIVLGMFLGIAQHLRVQHVDLQGAAAVFTIAP